MKPFQGVLVRTTIHEKASPIATASAVPPPQAISMFTAHARTLGLPRTVKKLASDRSKTPNPSTPGLVLVSAPGATSPPDRGRETAARPAYAPDQPAGDDANCGTLHPARPTRQLQRSLRVTRFLGLGACRPDGASCCSSLIRTIKGGALAPRLMANFHGTAATKRRRCGFHPCAAGLRRPRYLARFARLPRIASASTVCGSKSGSSHSIMPSW